ncbi:hypothetical protein H072_9874 [Dactylellina haptotyla CBS 200.50]|uniref:Altered inheritance of mitochondria protein 21 n=1 Tax=Dactylellina haptotyla (strain CBS 200.50) TaxID=1284197 RepID=S8BMW6_DACHA|nr:hypothetical protein H072_9874 [Dactylellina haptotyla CBS 200.50]
MSSLPVVPPRPARGAATSPPETAGQAPPMVPERPARNRSKSPLPESHSSEAAAPATIKVTEAPSSLEESSDRPSSPETKRKIDPNLDLHHPMAVRPASEMPKAPHHDDIPEIGQRVPMLDFAGDVQAPSPFHPDSRSASRTKRRSQHNPHLPPEHGPIVVGDFGAYPGGKVYRQNGNYSLSHDDLTKSVMTPNGLGVATTPGLEGVPDEEIGYAATDEMASRNATPQATPGGAGQRLPTKSPLSTAISVLDDDMENQLSNLDEEGSQGVYGKSSAMNASSTSLVVPTSGRHTPWEDIQDEHADGTPILASDEAGKSSVWNPPVISPRLSAQDVRRPPSSNRSRHSPSVLPAEEDISDPPSPIKEHVPLFPEGAAPPRAPSRPKLGDKQPSSQRFPSKDVWEDAPESSHATYEVEDEAEVPDPEYYDPREAKLKEEAEASKKALTTKEATEPAKTGAAPPVLPTRPVKRVPTDENAPVSPESKTIPAVPDRPKPSIPPRPTKKISEPSSATSAGSMSPEESRSPPLPKPKPVIPGRVGGGGIAALRANFMNDLNSRLSKGPTAPKKEDPAPDAAEAEPKEREPLEDVRKTRARGPAKRKPTTAGATATEQPHVPKLTFSSIITVYSIGDDYEVSFDETKFDDEPSKIARPMEEKIVEGLKGADAEELDTSKQVTAVDTSAAIISESEPIAEEKTDVPAEESKEDTTPASMVDTIKEVTAKAVDTVLPSSTEESKPETSTEDKTVTA